MKKFSLLILSLLLLSCSSDDEDAKEGNFLEVYNGVVWKEPLRSDDPDYGFWYVFKPDSFFKAEDMGRSIGCLSDTYKWGIVGSEEAKFTIKENSKNLLKIDCTNGVSSYDYTMTITTSQNGTVLNVVGSGEENFTEKYDKVNSEPCK